jgi:hypothetical protein
VAQSGSGRLREAQGDIRQMEAAQKVAQGGSGRFGAAQGDSGRLRAVWGNSEQLRAAWGGSRRLRASPDGCGSSRRLGTVRGGLGQFRAALGGLVGRLRADEGNSGWLRLVHDG